MDPLTVRTASPHPFKLAPQLGGLTTPPAQPRLDVGVAQPHLVIPCRCVDGPHVGSMLDAVAARLYARAMSPTDDLLSDAARAQKLEAAVRTSKDAEKPRRHSCGSASVADHEAGLRAHEQVLARWNDALRGLFTRADALEGALREMDPDAIDQVLTFLEADLTFHRSGYLKADLMHRLANLKTLDLRTRARMQDVVVARLQRPQARLFRHAVRLADAVWDEPFGERISCLSTGDDVGALEARRLLYMRSHHGHWPPQATAETEAPAKPLRHRSRPCSG